jgi:23S rRNA pseudouridine1911/1915/1917 synthase
MGHSWKEEMEKFTVKEDSRLQDFLFTALQGFKKVKVRNYLKYGAISVNGTISKKRDHCLHKGDEVTIQTNKREIIAASRKYPFKIIFEDDDIIVVDKPAGLLTIATDKEKDQTLYRALTEYVGIRDRTGRARIFIVHRIDRDTSGLIVFARKGEAKEKMQDDWRSVEKRYLAVAEGAPKKDQGIIKTNLVESKFRSVHSGPLGPESKLAVTRYKVLEKGDRYSLVEISLDTGRKHQIRVHMADMGCPIAGDKRYGAKTDPANRLALHASYLSFKHPATGKALIFQSPLPESLRKMLKG